MKEIVVIEKNVKDHSTIGWAIIDFDNWVFVFPVSLN